MVRTHTQKRRSLSGAIVGFAAVAIAVIVLSFFMLRPAQGSGKVSGDTIGIGDYQSTQELGAEVDSADKLNVSLPDDDELINDRNVTQAATLTEQASRSITVKDPDPVVELAAVDKNNPSTYAKALQVGTLNALPTAPRMIPDVSEDGWMVGLASAYDLETNQGWDATASGVLLSRESITVAVPASQSYLLGAAVEIVYGDKVVVATVTDTGGFAKYGRDLDLAAGVWKALGADTYGDWGVRTVHYRFL